MPKFSKKAKLLKKGVVSRGAPTLEKPHDSALLQIDPALFTEAQWCEAANVDADEILQTDMHHRAELVTATHAQVLALADDCRSKARRVADGELGESDPSEGLDINEWARDLEGAAAVLEKLAGVESPARATVVRLDSNELATVLAALRLFQKKYEDEGGDTIAEDWPDHFTDDKGERIEPLGSEDIDTLCERINR